MTDNEILELTPELPEDFNKTVRRLFNWQDYFFTWKELNCKWGYCTKCRKTLNLDWSREQLVTPHMIEAYQHKHNDYGRCPNCGTLVQWKDRNRGRKKLNEENYLYFIQSLSNGGIMLRTLFCRRNFSESIKNDFEYSEQHRVFFFGGKTYKYRRRPNYLNPYFLTVDNWYSNCSGDFYFEKIERISTPTPNQSKAYGHFNGDLCYLIDENIFTDSDYKYCCIEEYLMGYKRIVLPIVEYLALFSKNPSLVEKMMKQGFREVISEKFETDTRGIVNWRKPTVTEALGLTKGDIKKLKQKNINSVFAMQAKYKYGLSDLNAVKLQAFCVYPVYNNEIIKLFKNPVFDNNKLVKFLHKGKIQIWEYRDYLKQLDELQIQKTDSTLYPPDFVKAHNNLSAEINRRIAEKFMREEKKKMEELSLKDSSFKKEFKRLREDLQYENTDFIIRPAEGRVELLKESNVLGHCVYKNYAENYVAMKTIICVIRRKSDLETPFYTLELSTKYSRIIQCRTKGNKGMTDEVKAFTNEWFEWLHSDKKEKETEKKCQKTTAA